MNDEEHQTMDEHYQTLAQLPPSQKAEVVKIVPLSPEEEPLINDTTKRLKDLGFIAGEIVTALHHSPFSGGPKSYFVRGTTIVLRNTEASRILIKKPPMLS